MADKADGYRAKHVLSRWRGPVERDRLMRFGQTTGLENLNHFQSGGCGGCGQRWQSGLQCVTLPGR